MSQNKQKLIDAFNKADAAGNTDDAQFFADKLKSLETKQKLPEEITDLPKERTEEVNAFVEQYS